MWKCLFGRNQSLVSSLNMCLLQGCTALRGDQRLGAACSGSICHQPTNSLTSSVTEATFERGESLFWLCYPGITRNFNPIIASHSSSMGDGAGETPTVCALGSWPPHLSRWRVRLSTDDRALASRRAVRRGRPLRGRAVFGSESTVRKPSSCRRGKPAPARLTRCPRNPSFSGFTAEDGPPEGNLNSLYHGSPWNPATLRSCKTRCPLVQKMQ